MSDPVYLDYNATTLIDPRVVEAMLPFLGEHFGNPSSDHAYGRRAKAAALIAAGPDEFVFTGCATEANNLARAGLEAEAARLRALRDDLQRRLADAIPGLLLNGHDGERLPNTLNVSFPGAAGWQLLAAAPPGRCACPWGASPWRRKSTGPPPP